MRLLPVLESEELSVGALVVTPSGRRAMVVKTLKGTSKRDYFQRVIVRYVGMGGEARLQPQLLRRIDE